jgi:hypothetical protein
VKKAKLELNKTKKSSRLTEDIVKSNYLMYRYNVDLDVLNQLRLMQEDSDKPLSLNVPN